MQRRLRPWLGASKRARSSDACNARGCSFQRFSPPASPRQDRAKPFRHTHARPRLSNEARNGSTGDSLTRAPYPRNPYLAESSRSPRGLWRLRIGASITRPAKRPPRPRRPTARARTVRPRIPTLHSAGAGLACALWGVLAGEARKACHGPDAPAACAMETRRARTGAPAGRKLTEGRFSSRQSLTVPRGTLQAQCGRVCDLVARLLAGSAMH